MKIKNVVILTMVLVTSFVVVEIASAEDMVPTTYKTYVDSGMGFYKVRDITNQTHKFEYKDRVLNINQGDTIVWENDAEKSVLTIVSEQGLWGSNVGYLRVGQQTSYKFDKIGNYIFYIKGAADKRQIVVVAGKAIVVPMDTPIVIKISETVPSPLPTIDENIFGTPVKVTPMRTTVTSTPIAIATPVTTSKNKSSTIVDTYNTYDAIKEKNANNNSNISSIIGIDIDLSKFINISAVSIAGIIVAILVLVVAFRSGRSG